jgi:putative PIN family toxin of toxin-antitoxin system
VSQFRFVLDTNVVLDWLVFDDAATDELRDSIETHRATVLTHELAIAELQRVLSYPALNLSVGKQANVLAKYVAHTVQIEMPLGFSRDNLLLPASFPRCRDRDDQFLFALALHGKADVLITRDRQVLLMARRVTSFGIRIVDLQNYSAV